MLPRRVWTLAENASLQAQARSLAEAAGMAPEPRLLVPRFPWRHVAPVLWPRPLAAIEPAALASPWPELLIGCGGKAAAVLGVLHRHVRTVIVQHPRLDIRRFDLVVASDHDELRGPNVLSVRTAVHGVTPARLAAAAAEWAPRFAALPRPLVSVLVGGSNGRFTLDMKVARVFVAQLAAMMDRDGVGLAVTPSRRTAPEVRALLAAELRPRGALIYDFSGDNPYFGLLACADAIVVTSDSVSMVSEAVATNVPVMLVPLPGRSHRIGLFLRSLRASGRVRDFAGRLEEWPVAPIDDTPETAAEMVRRFGY